MTVDSLLRDKVELSVEKLNNVVGKYYWFTIKSSVVKNGKLTPYIITKIIVRCNDSKFVFGHYRMKVKAINIAPTICESTELEFWIDERKLKLYPNQEYIQKLVEQLNLKIA